jgi:phenylalanyl-tRNA synthetase beta chain
MQMDVAVLVDEQVPHAAIVQAIRAAGAPLLESVRAFDVYRGEPVPPGRKSIAYAVTYRASDRTLTEEEAEQVHARIERRLRDDFGAQIRGRERYAGADAMPRPPAATDTAAE